MNADVPVTPGSFMRLLTRKHGMADVLRFIQWLAERMP